MDYKKLGYILKQARTAKKLSQSQAAIHVSKTPQNISSWELGKSKIDIDSFECLCSLYDIPFEKTLMAASTLHTSKEPLHSSDMDIFSLVHQMTTEEKNFIKHAILFAASKKNDKNH